MTQTMTTRGRRFARSTFFTVNSSFFIAVAVALLASCSKSAPEWTEPEPRPETDAVLKVRTRGAEGDHAPTLPIRIYAFDEEGALAGTQIMTAADAPIALPLAAGGYTLYAVTGADAARYDVPVAASGLTSGEAFALKTPYDTHGEVGAACEHVTLTNGETSQLTLTVTRIVAQLTAALTNIPDDIAAVSVRVTPLYTGFTVGGALTGDPGGATIPLTKTAPGEWGTPVPLFMLPGTGNATITVALTGTAGTMEYAFASDVPLAANYKLHIGARYEAAPVLDGSITGTDWAGNTLIGFDFGPGTATGGTQVGGGTDNGPGPGDTGQTVAGIPSVGDVYRGCYVLSARSTGASTAEVLLVAPRHWDNIAGSSSAGLLDAAGAVFAAYTHDGLSGWRLPNLTEATLLYELIRGSSEVFDSTFVSGDPALPGIDYLYNDGGSAYKFNTSTGYAMSGSPIDSGTLHALAVRTLAVTA